METQIKVIAAKMKQYICHTHSNTKYWMPMPNGLGLKKIQFITNWMLIKQCLVSYDTILPIWHTRTLTLTALLEIWTSSLTTTTDIA